MLIIFNFINQGHPPHFMSKSFILITCAGAKAAVFYVHIDASSAVQAQDGGAARGSANSRAKIFASQAFLDWILGPEEDATQPESVPASQVRIRQIPVL